MRQRVLGNWDLTRDETSTVSPTLGRGHPFGDVQNEEVEHTGQAGRRDTAASAQKAGDKSEDQA